MDPFDWTKDKSIYQRWQLWSEKARLALDAMEGDSEKTKISYFHHWINGEGMGHIESWENSKTLISQSAYDELENTEGKYSSECIESYFTLFELLLAPKSNPLLAVEELHFAKQGCMTSGEFHSHIVKIAKRCKFPNPEAESYQGCNLLEYEQSTGQGQSYQSDELGGKRTHSGIYNESTGN